MDRMFRIVYLLLVTSALHGTRGFLLDSAYQQKQYSCNFESSSCQYTPQPAIHGLMWLRHQVGMIPSLPRRDHTYNSTGSGHVMYIPPSSNARPGDTIILQSTVLDGLKGNIAVGFWYTISGGSIITSIRLNVTVMDQVTRKAVTTIKAGQRIGEWYHGCLVTNTASGNVTVTFQADYYYTAGYPAIALDDVTIEPGSSCSTNTMTSTTPSPTNGNGTYMCTFETNLCIYSPKLTLTGDNWSIKSIPPGCTELTNTDHTLGQPGTGHVIQINTRSAAGSKFQFQSKTLTDYPTGSYVTIDFWYRFPHTGMVLNMYIHGGTHSPLTPIFSRPGRKILGWTQACVTTVVQGPVEFVFEAVVEHSYVANTILVDDITIQPGKQCANAVKLLNTSTAFGNVSCDFEDASLCGYTNVAGKSDSFDWLRHKGPTPSANTGPARDHTTGSGYYMYIETSSHVRGDNALLESPPFVAKGQQTVTFWYNTYGNSIGSLNVYLEHLTETGTILGKPLFQVSRAMTDESTWQKGCIEIPKIIGLIQVVFEGVSGFDFHSDIAIDDVKLNNGNCSTTSNEHWLTWGQWSSCSHTCGNATRERTRTCSSFGCSGSRIQREECIYVYCEVTCSFVASSVCGYLNKKDDFSWAWHSGTTISEATGPLADHTTGNGHYMYIESSSPRQQGDSATLQSPHFVPEGSQRLTFWYSAYGTNIGSMSVSIQHKSFLNLITHSSDLFSINTGTQSRKWYFACADIPPSNSESYIVFKGVVGNGYNGDIGIDDVKLERGNCTALVTTSITPTQSTSTITSTMKSTMRSTMTATMTSSTKTSKLPSSTTRMFTTNTSPQTTSIVGSWSHWYYDPCSVSCGNGTRSRVRHCSTGSDIHCGGNGFETVSCNEGPCPVNGGWSAWSSYSACTVTCGSGHMTSVRVCNSPTPLNNGLSCQGNSTRQTTCHQNPCIVNGNWSDWEAWSTCSVSCNFGTRTRDRSCDNPAPQNGGKSCVGDADEAETCNNNTCPEWSHWFYESCSATCGNGTMLRIRHCSTGNDVDCGDVSLDSVFCNDGGCPVHGNWGVWGAYSACSVTCGDGNMTSTRTCDSPAPLLGGNSCQGEALRLEPCHLASCVVDGKWSVWNAWSSCSASCATGTKSRSRTCDHPPPANGGLGCSGSYNETEKCNEIKCPEWSEWYQGNCHVTCGPGNKTRIRYCSSGNNVDCGNETFMETIACDGGSCPVNGAWGSWSVWGVCSQSCGNGTRDRNRKCDNPAPQYGGTECTGVGHDMEMCNLADCPYWLPYQQNSACSVTCGRGFESYKRTCSTGIPSDCPGSAFDERACILDSCV